MGTSEASVNNAWTDDPIENAKDDALERKEFAARAAAAIRDNHSWNSSVVFGLIGPWGSGKSSLVNMIRNEIESADKEWAVRSFVPWAANDSQTLLGEFFATLSAALPKSKGKAAKRALAACAEVVVPSALTLIPYAGDAAASGARAVATAVLDKPWTARFQEASDALRDLKKPVLIVADDIDRLQADELLELLKVVRLLGRFPGVQYLLAYDDQTITDVIATSEFGATDADRARKFIEKIVQYPLEIPPAQPVLLDRRLNSGLNKVLSSRPPLTLDDDQRLSEAYDLCMRPHLGTVRSIDRYLAQLRQYFPMHPPGEVNDADLVILTFIRLNFPRLYRELPQLRTLLTREHAKQIYIGLDGLENSGPDWDEVLGDLVATGDLRLARTLLGQVFPAVADRNAPAGEATPSRTLRACFSEYFGRYFTVGIPVDDVADGHVHQLLLDVGSGGDPTELLTLLTSQDLGARAMSKCIEQSVRSARSTVDLVVFSMMATANALDHTSELFPPRMRAKTWSSMLIGRLPPDTDVDVLVTRCLETDVRPIDLIEILQRASGKVDFEDFAEQERRVAEVLSAGILRLFTDAQDTHPPFSVPYALRLIEGYTGVIEALRSDTESGVAEGRISPSRVVAHFVGIEDSGSSAMLVDIDGEALAKLLPTAKLSPFTTDTGLDLRDASWSNRENYARIRIESA